MNIQLINPFTNNLLLPATDGLMEIYVITFPKKNSTYPAVAATNYSQNIILISRAADCLIKVSMFPPGYNNPQTTKVFYS